METLTHLIRYLRNIVQSETMVNFDMNYLQFCCELLYNLLLLLPDKIESMFTHSVTSPAVQWYE